MNIDVKKFIPYIATAMVTLLICWFLWNNNDDLDNERRQLKAERELLEARAKKHDADSIALRDEMQREANYWKRRYEEKDKDYERLEKNSKISLDDFSDSQLDSIRRRLYAN